MIFNPLFFNNPVKEGDGYSLKASKAGTGSFLFSDIIKVYNSELLNTSQTLAASKDYTSQFLALCNLNQNGLTQNTTNLSGGNTTLASILSSMFPELQNLFSGESGFNLQSATLDNTAANSINYEGNINGSSLTDFLQGLLQQINANNSDNKNIDYINKIFDAIKSGKNISIEVKGTNGKINLSLQKKNSSDEKNDDTTFQANLKIIPNNVSGNYELLSGSQSGQVTNVSDTYLASVQNREALLFDDKNSDTETSTEINIKIDDPLAETTDGKNIQNAYLSPEKAVNDNQTAQNDKITFTNNGVILNLEFSSSEENNNTSIGSDVVNDTADQKISQVIENTNTAKVLPDSNGKGNSPKPLVDANNGNKDELVNDSFQKTNVVSDENEVVQTTDKNSAKEVPGSFNKEVKDLQDLDKTVDNKTTNVFSTDKKSENQKLVESNFKNILDANSDTTKNIKVNNSSLNSANKISENTINTKQQVEIDQPEVSNIELNGIKQNSKISNNKLDNTGLEYKTDSSSELSTDELKNYTELKNKGIEIAQEELQGKQEDVFVKTKKGANIKLPNQTIEKPIDDKYTEKTEGTKTSVDLDIKSNPAKIVKQKSETTVEKNVEDKNYTTNDKINTDKSKNGLGKDIVSILNDKDTSNKNSVKPETAKNSIESETANKSSFNTQSSMESNQQSSNQSDKKQTHETVAFAKEISNSAKVTKTETAGNLENTKTVKFADIMKEISRFVINRDKGSVTMNLEPETLGKLKVTLDIVENSAKVVVEVENEAVKKLVENNVTSLFQNLNQNGLTLSHLQVSTSSGEQKQMKSGSSSKKKFDLESEISDDPEQKLKIKNYGYNTYEFLA